MTTPSLELTLESNQPSPLQLLGPLAALAFVIGVVASGAGSQTVWYVIRGTGVIAYLLLSISIAIGLLITTRALPSGRPRVDIYEVHTFTTLLALAFTAVHGLALLLDSYIGFSPSQIIIPFTAGYRPFAVSLGILGGYVAVAVYGSFWLRRRIGYKTWRTLHFASFAAFVLAAAHGILSGADSGTWWLISIYVGSIVVVFGLLASRISAALAGPRKTALHA